MAQAYDVIVAGGGPAGVAAAIAAARRGARTLMVEKNPFAGGTWTAGMMNAFLDHTNKQGVIAEIRERLDRLGAWVLHRGRNAPGFFAVEPMKVVLDELLEEAGVDVRYQTMLYAARSSDRRVVEISTASKSGSETWSAEIFVDATGDGDLGAYAGCGFDLGRAADGKMQPASMYALVGGWPDPLPDRDLIVATLERSGYELTYSALGVSRFPGSPPGVAVLNLSHLYGVDATCAESLTRAEIEGRRQVFSAVESLKRSGEPVFRDLCVLLTGPFVAIREGRRIHGLFTVTERDARAGRAFEDGICEVTFNFDVHHVSPDEGHSYWYEAVPPYQIPYRSLVARDVDNLLLAGRCISGDFVAHSSYRVVGDAVPLGEVAGAAAAVACQRGIAPADVPTRELTQIVGA